MISKWKTGFIAILLALKHGVASPMNSTAWKNDTSSNTANIASVLASDPTTFSWVHHLAAIGDSFTAGIGAGSAKGGFIFSRQDWLCSRYDEAYPELIRDMIGSSLQTYQFNACSGDRSEHIYKQVMDLKENVDLLVMTAGGNDLCLATMIKNCIVTAFLGEAACEQVINKAQENIDHILKYNLVDILKALDSKMAKDGIVVFNGYARFFNVDNEDCAVYQDWDATRDFYPRYWFSPSLRLTVERRKKFNRLVENTNKAIREAIKEVSGKVKYTIGFSDWDPWAIEGVRGQMCDPTSTGVYPDTNQPDLQFFKPSTVLRHSRQHEQRRELETARITNSDKQTKDTFDRRIYDSVLWKTPDPRAEARHRLDKRAPAPPRCPGDPDMEDSSIGLGTPDYFGKWFHPNSQGHVTIASFAVAKAIDLRAKVLGVAPQTCDVVDEFKCWQKVGRRGYVTSSKVDENYRDFCSSVKQPDHTVGWKFEKTYFAGTPDEHTFLLQLGEKTATYVQKECLESFERIIHGCDGNDPENPLNWKFGGRWRRGEYTYELNVKRDNRPWPPIKKTYGSCNGNYRLLLRAGWSSWDHGKETFLPKIKDCLGLGVTGWNWKYFDRPDADGMEWKVKFNTPIWVRARCFKNDWASQRVGGWTNGCSGSD